MEEKSESKPINIISCIATVISATGTVIGDEKIREYTSQNATIISAIISYGLYLIILFFILKVTNKVLEQSKQEGKIGDNAKILKSLKIWMIASCLIVSIFKCLLVYGMYISVWKWLFIIAFFVVGYRVIYCLYKSDVEKIHRFKNLFLVNIESNQNSTERNQNDTRSNQNKFYEILYILLITIVMFIVTYIVAILLGIDFVAIISGIN